jgi:ABC-type nitrate/sulfonate/bicarbonate transport system substrate-binding protein
MAVSRRAFLGGCAALTVAAGARRAQAQGLVPIQVGYVPGLSALPLLTGVYLGMFADEGLAVDAEPDTTPSTLFNQLDDGVLHFAHTSIDNAIACDVGAGPSTVASRDFVAILGVDHGELRLIARRGIIRIAQLRGKTLAVDALTMGNANALRALLAAEGLADDEYRLVARGSAQQRASGLVARRFDATLLTPPFDLSLRAAGCMTLAHVTDVLGTYQGVTVVARRAWLHENASAATRYMHAYCVALEHAASDKTGSIPLLARALHVPPAVAAASYDAAFKLSDGFCHDGNLDLDGIRTVLRLRARYAPPGGGDDPAPYIQTTIAAPEQA